MPDIRDHHTAILAFYCMNYMKYLRLRSYVAFQMINEDEDDTVGQDIDHRIFPRKKKFKYDYDRARESIELCYRLDHPNPNIDGQQQLEGFSFFETFRISKRQYETIAQRLAASCAFFTQRTDACGAAGATPEAKILMALKRLADGTNPCASHRDYFMLGRTTARLCLNTFVRSLREVFEDEYLRTPTRDDIRLLHKLHLWKHKIPGMLGSLDVSHFRWKNCPKALHGQFKGRDKKPSVALESLTDYNMWIWHGSCGYPGG